MHIVLDATTESFWVTDRLAELRHDVPVVDRKLASVLWSLWKNEQPFRGSAPSALHALSSETLRRPFSGVECASYQDTGPLPMPECQ